MCAYCVKTTLENFGIFCYKYKKFFVEVFVYIPHFCIICIIWSQ